jgi:hypothetical protein
MLGLAVAPASWQGSEFQTSLELTAQGRFAEAMARAEAPQLDALSRSQARFWALYKAGLLDRARDEVRSALESAPADPWLLARATELSLTLHDAESAARHLQAWESALGDESAELVERRVEVAAALAVEARQSAGLQRARALSFGLLTACCAALCWLLRSAR